MENLVAQIKLLYSDFSPNVLGRLDGLYSNEIEFIDPFHRLHGLEALRTYFKSMMAENQVCQFDFKASLSGDKEESSELRGAGELVLFWTMTYSHPKLAGGKQLSLDGCSHIKYADKIYFHRDYYDAGEMLYEHIPLIGAAVKFVKRRLAVS